MKNRPPYAIASVDAALLLATLLQQEGPMRITDAAQRLGVSPSTAHRLVDELGETANLMVLAGADVRFVATVECDQVLRVGDRTGRTLPAHLVSGGKALLAALPPEGLDDVLRTLDVEDSYRLQRELRTVRRRGFAVNDQVTETGLTAVGAAVPVDTGTPPAAISVAMPTARYSRDRLPDWGAAVTATAAAIGRDLAEDQA